MTYYHCRGLYDNNYWKSRQLFEVPTLQKAYIKYVAIDSIKKQTHGLGRDFMRDTSIFSILFLTSWLTKGELWEENPKQ